MSNIASSSQPFPQEILNNLDVDGFGTVKVDETDEEMKERIKKLLPGAKSAIVLFQEVFTETIRHITSKAFIGDMALRDLFSSNSDIANGHLNWEAYNLVRGLHKMGYKGLVLPAKGGPYGSKYLEGPVSYKKLAEMAGMGTVGWNSLLLTPKHGPKVRLACVISDISLETSDTSEGFTPPCVECGGACSKICPINAITVPTTGANYQIDKYACNTYCAASGACSECLKACPGFKD